MTNKVRYLVLSLMIVALASGTYFETSHRNKNGDAKATATNRAYRAPDFVLMDLSGKPVHLSDYRGKVVIVNFWATWCLPCRFEVPHFKELYSRYQDQRLEIIGIAVDEGGLKVVKPFVDDNQINYPIVLSDEKVDQAYGGIENIPTTFVIDRQGNIYKKYVGFLEPRVLETDIKALL